MNSKSFISGNAWRFLLVTSALNFAGCDTVDDIINGNDDDNVYYHLSLGTSLSVGVQPDSNGFPLPTGDGYADQLYDAIRPGFQAAGSGDRELNFSRLGCPGETLDSFTNGGSCFYLAGSQLEAAVDYLNDNAGRVHLVTIDMGANDFRNAGCITDVVDIDCINAVSAQISTDLGAALTTLSNAAGPNTTIIGMNYYNPYLGEWIVDAAGQTLATQSAQAAVIFNDMLSSTYATAGIPMADVYAAFESDDFVTIVPSSLPLPNEQLPLSVANICTFTYMCDPDPVGPDIHANNAGYALIAETMEGMLP
jgi:lysophospholipase L1-like esterase